MSFSDIFAQHISIRVLRQTLLAEQVGHAYLFYGPEGIGKRTTALAYAKALNCTEADARAQGDFCGTCRSCRMIDLGQHPDVRLLTPETTGGKTVIPIDAIRTKVGEASSHPLPLREDAQLKPLEGRRKVYILDPANRPGFQEEAGNALLLTLEEPPPYVTIILISSRPSAVLTTLVSRCRPIRFQLAMQDDVMQALHARSTLSEPEIVSIAGMASGRIGWALSVAADPQILAIRRTLFDAIVRLLPAGRPAALRLAETMRTLAASSTGIAVADEDDGKAKTSADRITRRNLPELLDMTASLWRDLVVSEIGQPERCINQDMATEITRHAGRIPLAHLQQGLQVVLRTKRLIERNANIDLALERMWMAILP